MAPIRRRKHCIAIAEQCNPHHQTLSGMPRRSSRLIQRQLETSASFYEPHLPALTSVPQSPQLITDPKTTHLPASVPQNPSELPPITDPKATHLPASIPQSPSELQPITDLKATHLPASIPQNPSELPPITDPKTTHLPASTPQILSAPRPITDPKAALLVPPIEQFQENPPRYCPDAVDKFVTQWVESESYRERHWQLGSESDNLTKSALDMINRQDADGSAMPSLQSIGLFDVITTTGSGQSRLVESPLYRETNLAANNIYLLHPCHQLPQHIADLVSDMGKDRASVGPTLEQIEQDTRLYDLQMSCTEPKVEKYFQINIFPDPESGESLKRTDKTPMARHTIPEVNFNYRVSSPIPDILYGYNYSKAFQQQVQLQLRSMELEIATNSEGLAYPFFVIEYKGDRPRGAGSMWVATNQCLGGSASCVNVAERLNYELKKCEKSKESEVQMVESAAFSIAMSGTEARLHISWKHDGEPDCCHMRFIKSFSLLRPDNYLEFRKYILNILDWGRIKRLKQIEELLEFLLEQSRQEASKEAKSRPLPLDNSASGGDRKRGVLRRGKS